MSIEQFLSPRQQIVGVIESERDVIYACPKYCLGEQLLNSIMAEFRGRKGTRCAYLTPKLKPTTRDIDYATAWQSVAQQLGIKSKSLPADGDTFKRCLVVEALNKMSGKVILFLRVLGAGKEEETYQLLYSLNRLSLAHRTSKCSLSLVCLDDFSFWFYERYFSHLESEIIMTRITYSAVSPDETRGLVTATFGGALSAQEVGVFSEVIQNLSGGHIGLVGEMCDRIKQSYGQFEPEKMSDRLRKAAMQSEIFEGLRRDIEEDPIGLTKTALEFVKPSVAIEYASPRYQYLRQLGILQWYSPAELVLCQGLIREFVEGVSKALVQRRLGTVVTNYGMREFVDEELQITDDDFVLLHLSDLHVGKEHGYRLSFEGRTHQEGKETLTDLIERDLKRMKVVERVDAVIISGDLVCTGESGEFSRVKTIVERIMQVLSLKKDAVLIIPGNHDLKWNPGDFTTPVSPDRQVSMEEFQTLLERLGMGKFLLSNMLSLVSRSGHNKLRLVGIDSNDVEGPEAGGIGYVSKETLTVAEKLLDADPIAGFADIATWLVVHHHVLPVTSATRSDARGKKISVMSNAQDLLTAAAKWGVEAILHGHEHQPSITWAQRWAGQKFDGIRKGICVIGAGSCGAAREYLGPVSRNQYYLLVKRPDNILIRSRVIGEEGIDFMPHNDIVISSNLGK
jgi:predicted MPP superfamily phosphohydrolase